MSKHFAKMADLNKALLSAGEDSHELVLEGIEALKRWIYRLSYQGPEKKPEPKTESEFADLMNELRRWAVLYAPHIAIRQLEDYRRAELSLPSACGAARDFPDQLVEGKWWQAAHSADDVLNELRILLSERVKQEASKRRMSRKEANEKGKELAKQLGKAFFLLSEREQARRIGCSWKTWQQTELYKSAKKKRPKLPPKNRPGSRRVVSFTRDLELVTGEGEREEVLKRLVKEQEADDEPSSLDDDRQKKVHFRKRL